MMRKRIFLGILVVAILSVALPAQAEFVPEKYGFYVLEGINGPILIEAHVFDTNGGCVGFNGKRLVPALKQGELNFIFYTGEKLKQGQLSLSRFDWQEEVGETQYGTKRAVQLFTAQAVQPPGYRNIACDIFPKYAGDPDMFRISPTIVLPPGYYAFHNGYSNVALDFLVLDDLTIQCYKALAKNSTNFWNYLVAENYSSLRSIPAEIALSNLNKGARNTLLGIVVRALGRDSTDYSYKIDSQIDYLLPLDLSANTMRIPICIRIQELGKSLNDVAVEFIDGKIKNPLFCL